MAKIKPINPKTLLALLAIFLNTGYAVFQLSIQTSENPFLFGLSIQRLAIMAIMFVISLAFLFIIFLFHSKKENSVKKWLLSQQEEEKKYKLSFWLLLISYVLLLAGNIPPYRLGIWKGYWVFIQPMFIFLSINITITFLSWYPFTKSTADITISLKTFFQNHKSVWLIVCLVFLIVFGILLFFQSSLPKDQYFWNIAGVPILPEYGYLIFGLFFFIPLFTKAFNQHNSIFVNISFVVIAIFLITNAIFQQQPITKNFFIETRGEISVEYYPNSDARYYDVSGQAFINGLGINGGKPSDKPLYEAYVGILHFLMGDDYKNRVKLNVFILSLIPVFLFFIGKLLDSDEFGLLLAAFSIFFEITTFQSSGHISNIHWKVLTPEPITQLFVIMSVAGSILWSKNTNQKKWLYISGMAIALGMLIRPTTLFILPAFFLIILSMKGMDLKAKAISIGHSLFSFSLTVLPWFLYCYYHYGYIPLYAKFKWIQISRYSLSAFLLEYLPDHVFQPVSVAANTVSFITFPEKIYLMIGHFLNNIIKSLLILPYQFTMDSVPTIFTDIHYWSESINWNGQVSFVFFVNLLVFSIGIAHLFKKNRIIGLLPLIYMVFYFGALSLSRTSGSRYIVPVIWVVYLYYCIGIITIARFFIHNIMSVNEQPHRSIRISMPHMKLEKLSRLYFIFPLFLGILFPVIDFAIPLNQHLYLSADAHLELQTQPWIYDEFTISEEEWDQIINDSSFSSNYGKMIFANVNHDKDKDVYSITFELVGNRLLNNAFYTFENITEEEINSLNLKDVYYMKSCPAEKHPYFSPFLLIDVDQNLHFTNHENWQTCYENWKN